LDNIEHHIRDLVNICDHSNYVNEEAEVCLRCGEMYFDLKKVEESIKLLQGAVSGYQNHRHNQTVARWVLGIVMWEETDDHKEAIIQWKNCKETYRHLEDYHRFEREKVEWYQKIISEMDQALEEAIKQNTLINKNIYLLNNNNNV
jgi:tetratricopeptide (TPR) repeat protein